MGNAVSDSGPLIHLNEIKALGTLKIFEKVFVPTEVYEETRGIVGKAGAAVVLKELNAESKNFAKLVAQNYELHLGEAEAVALCRQERVGLLLTDDLDARDVAKSFGLDVHGTVGIVLRAFRRGLLSKKRAIDSVRLLQRRSSLFLTSDLVKYILNEINKFKK